MKTKLAIIIAYVLQTRRYGSTYIHAANRDAFGLIDGVEYGWGSYGRSMQAGGHKHKAYARRDGKPVPTVELKQLATKAVII